MLLRMAWLAPLAMIAIVLLSMLPLIGITAAAFVIYAAYRNMTRKRADSFVIRHLRTIDGVSRLLDAHEEYIVTCGRFSGVDDGGLAEPNDGNANAQRA